MVSSTGSVPADVDTPFLGYNMCKSDVVCVKRCLCKSDVVCVPADVDTPFLGYNMCKSDVVCVKVMLFVYLPT